MAKYWNCTNMIIYLQSMPERWKRSPITEIDLFCHPFLMNDLMLCLVCLLYNWNERWRQSRVNLINLNFTTPCFHISKFKVEKKYIMNYMLIIPLRNRSWATSSTHIRVNIYDTQLWFATRSILQTLFIPFQLDNYAFKLSNYNNSHCKINLYNFTVSKFKLLKKWLRKIL